MSPLRLAFTLVKYFPFGGMQRNFTRIARACAERGHEAHLLTSAWDGPRPDWGTVHVLPVRAWTNHGRNEAFNRAAARATADGAYDAVVGANRMAGLDIYYAGDPCLAAELDERPRGRRRWLPRYKELLRQEALVFAPDAATEILLSGHQEQARFIETYGTPAGRFHLLPPGIDRARLDAAVPTDGERTVLRFTCGARDSDRVLLAVGSGFRTKGVDRTIRAVAALPPEARARARLAVIGRGKSAALERLATRLGIGGRVRFLGAREDLASLYHVADLLVHPARRENTGNALLEAMVCGLPVLASAVCGYAMHVERAGAGCLCPEPYRQEALDALLASMIDDPRRAAWSAAGRAYADAEDLYSLIDRAADAVIDRAARNRRGATSSRRETVEAR